MNNQQKQFINTNIKEAKKFTERINIDVIVSSLFAFFGAIFGAFAMSGFRFSIDVFGNPEFWTKALISFGIMMFVYNFLKMILIRAEKQKDNTEYSRTRSRQDKFIKEIRDDHLEGLVEEKVNETNEQRRLNACQRLLDSVTYGLRVNDLDKYIDDDVFQDFVRKRRLNKKQAKRLSKAISDAMNSRVYFDVLKADDILIDTSLKHKRESVHDEPKMTINEREIDAKENIMKAVFFGISTAITNALIWDGLSAAFWVSLLTQTVLIITSVASAIASAYIRIRSLTLVTDNKCAFLNVVLQYKGQYMAKMKIKNHIEIQESTNSVSEESPKKAEYTSPQLNILLNEATPG